MEDKELSVISLKKLIILPFKTIFYHQYSYIQKDGEVNANTTPGS